MGMFCLNPAQKKAGFLLYPPKTATICLASEKLSGARDAARPSRSRCTYVAYAKDEDRSPFTVNSDRSLNQANPAAPDPGETLREYGVDRLRMPEDTTRYLRECLRQSMRARPAAVLFPGPQ